MRSLVAAVSCMLSSALAQAADIGVVGLFPGKAVLIIDGALPKTYAVGDKIGEGIQLLYVTKDSATFLIKGKQETLALGQHISKPATSSVPSDSTTAVLQADSRGHFLAQGQINGTAIRMMVDTGATLIALSADDAKRIGINYQQGPTDSVRTANGPMPVHLVKLEKVKVGDIELHHVDAAVYEGQLPFALLGMSFLNRTDMHREGNRMTLTKRY